MKGVISSRLFESLHRGIHGLTSSGKGAGGQHLDLLGVTDFGPGIDHFLSRCGKFLSEVSKLKDFSFNKRIPQPLHRSVDESLVRLSMFEDALTKGMEWGLGTVARSGT